MEKVKVTRYISGRRPDYAPSDSESELSEDEEGFVTIGGGEDAEEKKEVEEVTVVEPIEGEVADRRLRRLRERQMIAAESRLEIYFEQWTIHVFLQRGSIL